MRSIEVLRAAVAAVLIASAPAQASPLEPLWEAREPCNQHSVAAWGDALVTRAGDALVLLDRATGASRGLVSLKGEVQATWMGPVATVGERLVVANGVWFGVADRTGHLSWTGERLNGDSTEPVLHAVGGDLIVGRPLVDDAGMRVERLDGTTGAARWRSATEAGEVATAALHDDGTRLYAVALPRYDSTYVVTAFELATGKRLWRTELQTGQPRGRIGPSPWQHAATAAGRLFVAVPRGVFAFDPASGRPTDLKILGGRPSEQAIAVRGTRVYVSRDSGITAVDATTRTVVWSADLREPELGAATDDAVYAIDDTGVLYALDARTGADVGRYGVGETPVAYIATDGHSPVHIACIGGRLAAFGPAAAGPPVEQATITGRLLCRGCGRHGRPAPMADVEVAAGGTSVRTDQTGAFALRVTGRGTLRVTFALGEPPERFSGWRDPMVTVVLRGKRRYALGAIGARPLGDQLP